jgi:hypothetical protein
MGRRLDGTVEITSVNAIEEALDRVPRIEGMVGAVLVEAATGQVVGERRPETSASPAEGAADGTADAGGDGSTATRMAPAATDLVQVLALFAAQQPGAGPLDQLIVAFREQHHVVRPLRAPGLDGLFLLVSLDRRQANLALALHQMQAFESQIIA